VLTGGFAGWHFQVIREDSLLDSRAARKRSREDKAA